MLELEASGNKQFPDPLQVDGSAKEQPWQIPLPEVDPETGRVLGGIPLPVQAVKVETAKVETVTAIAPSPSVPVSPLALSPQNKNKQAEMIALSFLRKFSPDGGPGTQDFELEMGAELNGQELEQLMNDALNAENAEKSNEAMTAQGQADRKMSVATDLGVAARNGEEIDWSFLNKYEIEPMEVEEFEVAPLREQSLDQQLQLQRQVSPPPPGLEIDIPASPPVVSPSHINKPINLTGLPLANKDFIGIAGERVSSPPPRLAPPLVAPPPVGQQDQQAPPAPGLAVMNNNLNQQNNTTTTNVVVENYIHHIHTSSPAAPAMPPMPPTGVPMPPAPMHTDMQQQQHQGHELYPSQNNPMPQQVYAMTYNGYQHQYNPLYNEQTQEFSNGNGYDQAQGHQSQYNYPQQPHGQQQHMQAQQYQQQQQQPVGNMEVHHHHHYAADNSNQREQNRGRGWGKKNEYLQVPANQMHMRDMSPNSYGRQAHEAMVEAAYAKANNAPYANANNAWQQQQQPMQGQSMQTQPYDASTYDNTYQQHPAAPQQQGLTLPLHSDSMQQEDEATQEPPVLTSKSDGLFCSPPTSPTHLIFRAAASRQETPAASPDASPVAAVSMALEQAAAHAPPAAPVADASSMAPAYDNQMSSSPVVAPSMAPPPLDNYQSPPQAVAMHQHQSQYPHAHAPQPQYPQSPMVQQQYALNNMEPGQPQYAPNINYHPANEPNYGANNYASTNNTNTGFAPRQRSHSPERQTQILPQQMEQQQLFQQQYQQQQQHQYPTTYNGHNQQQRQRSPSPPSPHNRGNHPHGMGGDHVPPTLRQMFLQRHANDYNQVYGQGNGSVHNLTDAAMLQQIFKEDMYSGFIMELVRGGQVCCRLMQAKLDEFVGRRDFGACQRVFDEITGGIGSNGNGAHKNSLHELMSSTFGNYLAQRMFEVAVLAVHQSYGNDNLLHSLLRALHGCDWVGICQSPHGTRAAQKLVECMTSFQGSETLYDQGFLGIFRTSETQREVITMPDNSGIGNCEQMKQVISGKRVESAEHCVVEVLCSTNGCHVIQKMLSLHTYKRSFLFKALEGNVVRASIHKNGCCVLQRYIDHANKAQLDTLCEEITGDESRIISMATDKYANYVLQYLVSKIDVGVHVNSGADGNRNPHGHGHGHGSAAGNAGNAVTTFADGVARTACQKHFCTRLISALIFNVEHGGLLGLGCHKYASNVIEQSLEYASSEDLHMVMDLIERMNSDYNSRNYENERYTLSPMGRLLADGFGNYIVQRILFVSDAKGSKPETRACARCLRLIHPELLIDAAHYGSHPTGPHQQVAAEQNPHERPRILIRTKLQKRYPVLALAFWLDEDIAKGRIDLASGAVHH